MPSSEPPCHACTSAQRPDAGVEALHRTASCLYATTSIAHEVVLRGGVVACLQRRTEGHHRLLGRRKRLEAPDVQELQRRLPHRRMRLEGRCGVDVLKQGRNGRRASHRGGEVRRRTSRAGTPTRSVVSKRDESAMTRRGWPGSRARTPGGRGSGRNPVPSPRWQSRNLRIREHTLSYKSYNIKYMLKIPHPTRVRSEPVADRK